MRFQVVVALCVAVVVALWLDQLADRSPGRLRTLALVATGVAMLTWLPADQQVATPAVVPAYFAAGAPGLTRADVVETYPRSTGVWVGGARPMLWQVASGFAYRTTGGYFIGSDAQHDLLLEVAGQRPTSREPSTSRAAPRCRPPTRRRRPATSCARWACRRWWSFRKARTSRAVLDWTRRVTGLPGEQVDDVWLFRLTVG